ncbi:unnamed protein product, partial [Mesorhabditis spiculigera]
MDFMISKFCDEENSPPIQYLNNNAAAEDKGPNAVRLPPEMELGNVEYKVKLLNPSASRLEHLITQMKWRLREGQGEAIYEIGVRDDGAVCGLTDAELEASYVTLRHMASSLNATVGILNERDVTPQNSLVRRRAIEVLIRLVPENQQFLELRLAILGGGDVGKSTLCGVLTQGGYDDGQGSKRQALFRYPHELNSGKTSSICLDVVGFDSRGKIVNYVKKTLEEVVERSQKLVTLIDLAGDIKYLRTTIQGLSGHNPQCCCLLISAETGPTVATREHLGLVRALSIPFFVVLTKRDLVDRAQFLRVSKQVGMLLVRAGVSGGMRRVKSTQDALRAAANMAKGIIPVLAISSVTGEGHKLLRRFLNYLPVDCTIMDERQSKELQARNPYFIIEEVFNVPHVGTIACGMLQEGRINEGDKLVMGPAKNGSFELVEVGSIRRSRQPVRSILPGQGASIAINFHGAETAVRRGMVLQSIRSRESACIHFTANIMLLSHPTTAVCTGFQFTVYIGSVCQTAKLLGFDGAVALEIGKWTLARFAFIFHPEAVRVGTPLIIRQGKTKGMGEVVEIFPWLPCPSSC